MPTNQQWLPSSIQAQMLEQQKKQAMAQALLGSIPTAQPQMVGGRYISPGIGGAITNVAKALMDGKLQQDQLQSQADILRGMSGKWDMGSPESLIKAGMTPKSVKQYINNGDGTQLQKQPKEAGYSDFRYVDGGKTDIDPATGLKRVEVLYADGTRGMKPVPGGQTFNLGQDPYLKADAGAQAKQIPEILAAAQTGKKVLNSIQAARPLIDKMNTGTGADIKTFVQGLGHTLFGMSADEAAYSQEYQARVVDALQGLVKAIGGSQISDTDLKLARGYGGVDITQQAQALKRIMDKIEQDANVKVQTFNRSIGAYKGDPNFWQSQLDGTIEGYSIPVNPEGVGEVPKPPIPSAKDKADAEHTTITEGLRKLFQHNMGGQ